MENRDSQERYTHWRKPWGKWVCLVAGGLNLIRLWRDAADYQKFSSLGIFDTETMEEIQLSLKMSISTSAVLAVLFFGCVIIGCAARSEKTARRAEGGLFFSDDGCVWRGQQCTRPFCHAGMERTVYFDPSSASSCGGMLQPLAGTKIEKNASLS